MGQNIESTVNIKVTADTSQAQTAVMSLQDKMVAQYNALNSAIAESSKEPMKLTKQYYYELNNLLSYLKINTLNSREILPEEQFNKAIGLVRELEARLRELYKQSEPMSTQDIIVAQYNALNSAINDANNDPLKITKEYLTEINTLFQALSTSTLSLEYLIPEEQFRNALNLLIEAKTRIDELKVPEIIPFVSDKELDALNKEIETVQRLSSAFYKINEDASKLSDISTNTDKVSQSMGQLTSDINKLNNSNPDNKIIDFGDVDKKVEITRTKVNEFMNDIRNADFKDIFGSLGHNFEEVAQAEEKAVEATEELNKETKDLNNETGNSESDMSGLLNVLGGVASTGKISASTFKQLGSAIGMSGEELAAFGAGAAVIIGSIKLLNDNIKEVITGFTKVGSGIGEAAFNSIEWFADSLKEMVSVVDEAIQKLDELSNAGIELERAFLTTSAYIGQEATDELYNFIDGISSATNSMFVGMNDIVAAAGSMGLDSKELVEVTENMTIMGRNLGVLIGDTQRAFADLGTTISKGYVGRNSILYRIFTKQEIEQVRKLGSEVERYNFILERAGRVQELYNAYIQTASGKVSILRMQYKELMTNIGTIALNLYAMVAPVLTNILQLANSILNVFIEVFDFKPKSVGFNSIASDIGSSLEDVAESAGKANKQLASFDDVIQINDNKSSGLGGVGDLGGLEDFGGLLDGLLENSDDLYDRWAKFKELLEKGDWFGASAEFMHQIADILNGIDWNNIQEKAMTLGVIIASFLNGIFSNEDDWKSVGTTIAEAFNTITSFIFELVKDFNFEQAGKSLGAAWADMWDNIDTEMAGDTLYYAFTGVFDYVLGWLQGGGLSKMATSFSEIISQFFSDITEDDVDNIVSAADGIIDDIINALSIRAY